MFDYLRWMIGQDVLVVLRQPPETNLDGTLKLVNETALVIRYKTEEWVIALDCIAFVKVLGVSKAEGYTR